MTQSLDPISSIINHSRKMIAHSDINLSSRVLPVGYDRVKGVQVIVDINSRGAISCRACELTTVITPTQAYNGRSGKYPIPHLACDKAKYLFSADSDRLCDMYSELVKSFYAHSKLPSLKYLIKYLDSDSRLSFDQFWDGYGLMEIVKSQKIKIKKPSEIMLHIYICGKPLFDMSDSVFRDAWDAFLIDTSDSRIGFDMLSGEVGKVASKVRPISLGKNRSTILTLGMTQNSDGINVPVSDSTAVLFANGIQDLLDNNSRALSNNIAVVAYTDTLGVAESNIAELCLNSMKVRGAYVDDEDTAGIDDAKTQETIECDILSAETASVTPYLTSMSKFSRRFPKIMDNPKRDLTLTLVMFHIMPKGNASMMGMVQMHNALTHIKNYSHDTRAVLIYFSKAELMYRVTEFVPTLSDVILALSSHSKRTAKKREVKLASAHVTSYTELIDMIDVIAKGKCFGKRIVERMVSQSIRDLSVYGFDSDMKRVIAIVCAVYKNFTTRNNMEKTKLQLVSTNLGRMFAIGASVASNKHVVNTDRSVMDAINVCIERPREGLVFVHKSIVSVYLQKFKRVSKFAANKYRDEIAEMFTGWSVDDIDCRLDGGAFLVGFYQKTAELIVDRNEAIARSKLKHGSNSDT